MLEGVEAVNARVKRVFLGIFLIITPPALVLVSAAFSVAQERQLRDGRADPAPYWDVLFPLALIACFICIPAGVYMIFKALTRDA